MAARKTELFHFRIEGPVTPLHALTTPTTTKQCTHTWLFYSYSTRIHSYWSLSEKKIPLIFISLQRVVFNSLYSLMFISHFYFEKSNMCVYRQQTTGTLKISVSLVLSTFQNAFTDVLTTIQVLRQCSSSIQYKQFLENRIFFKRSYNTKAKQH